MPKQSTVGLSIQEAFQESLAESGLTGLDEVSVNTEPVTLEAAAAEQAVLDLPKDDQGVLIALSEPDDEEEKNPITDSTLIEVDGEQLTIKELIDGYLRRGDYTQKTQEVALLKKEAEDAITFWEALQADPQAVVRKLAQRINMGMTPFEGAPEPKAAGNSQDIAQLVAAEVQKALENDPRIKQVVTADATTRVEREFARIEGLWNLTLSPEDKQLVLRKAQETGSTDLEFVFAGLKQMADRRAAQKKALREGATSYGVSGTQAESLTSTKTPESFSEALEQAMKELNVSDLSKL